MLESLPKNPIERASVKIDRLNERFAVGFQAFVNGAFQTERFRATKEAVLALEGIALFSVGATLMQIGEWFFAVCLFVVLGFLLFAKALTLNGWIKNIAGCIGAVALSGVLIAITALHKPDSEPWSNLQKPWHQKDRQDIRLEFTQPSDPQISVRNIGTAVVRGPRYNLTLASLDNAKWDDKGILPVLRTNQQSFSQNDWLRPGQGFGGYALFDSANRPPEGSRLLGWVSCTCPECITERAYLVFVVFGESGWYYEVPRGRSINRQWFNSLFGKSEEKQQQLLDAGIPQNERIQFAP